ncbi:sulfur carrier protein ThiS [Comamonas sp. Y33R10-2]|uniref:sulfur carrier protein ThiS n=1 Tax=Comamonas sp. Y33R10-2 TaxID=2853257 RepID=UPI001C5CA458|nr:sulfur carrier protein ThiS [Comamonas sp. Y33R10-2]QXZ10580.1 sulfur carrier protein ThiS [Comamonas sp. Y33R10-2]
MKITLNQHATDLQANATVADALAQMQAKPPFAVAVNTIFVPKTQYESCVLSDGDKMEVISPVTGG